VVYKINIAYDEKSTILDFLEKRTNIKVFACGHWLRFVRQKIF